MTLTCRFCLAPLTRTFVDLGEMPLANAYPTSQEQASSQVAYPLHARVCAECLLVQVDDVVTRDELFSEYAYFSSLSTSWVAHARRFAEKSVRTLDLNRDSLVIEVASNDGYLLRQFQALGVRVFGIDPAANVVREAVSAGIPTEVAFFGKLAAEGLVRRIGAADLLVANNVFAHVPDLNDFTAGLKVALKPRGVISIEVPHILHLIERLQFDTIYHEHYSYFSLYAAEAVLAAHGLAVFDIDELATHGGSIRLWAGHEGQVPPTTERLTSVREREEEAGLTRLNGYEHFGDRVKQCRDSLVAFCRGAASRGQEIVAYGAAAKGNTLLNYCGLGTAEISYVVDRSPFKQGRFLPGSNLPIFDPSRVYETRPDFILLLAWNLRIEIVQQMESVASWGARFVVPIPAVEMIS